MTDHQILLHVGKAAGILCLAFLVIDFIIRTPDDSCASDWSEAARFLWKWFGIISIVAWAILALMETW